MKVYIVLDKFPPPGLQGGYRELTILGVYTDPDAAQRKLNLHAKQNPDYQYLRVEEWTVKRPPKRYPLKDSWRKKLERQAKGKKR